MDGLWAAAHDAAGKSVAFIAVVTEQAFNPEFNAQHRGAVLAVVFLSLATGSLIIPVPEEILLGIVGFTFWIEVQTAPTNWLFLLAAVPICCAVVVCGDALIWCAGRTLGLAVRARFSLLARAIPPQRIVVIESALARNGGWAVLAARLIPGARLCTFFVAGSIRMPIGRFLAFDILGSLVSVPLCLGLGILAADDRYGAPFVKEICAQCAQWVLPAILVAILGAWIVGRIRRSTITPDMEGSA